MKIKGNIHKVINMNNYIHSLKNEHNIITYAAIYIIILTMIK